MSTDDLLKIVLAIIGTGGPLGILFAAYKGTCDKCWQERDEYRKANDAALEAARKREAEIAAWAWEQKHSHRTPERP